MNPATYPPRRVAFRVEYDGTGFSGWQKQNNTPTTIQQSLEEAWSAFVGHDVAIQGASRTDAGVHARGQLAAVTVQHPAQLSGMIKAVNAKLTRQIAVRDPVLVTSDYNPRFGNDGKAYSYHIYTDTLRRPLLDRWATRCPWLLNLEDMNRAAGYCTGTHDFTSFAAADGSHKTAVRTIDKFSCTALDTGLIRFDVRGTAFMKNMVRILVGTMLEVGRGRIPACQIPQMIAAENRQAAGPTAPPQGLCLEEVFAEFQEISTG
ncbi:MAG: tRNA pseudouridine(38-40) synthase TruA [Bradymonadia bacterium]